jgi:hypothetical protein
MILGKEQNLGAKTVTPIPPKLFWGRCLYWLGIPKSCGKCFIFNSEVYLGISAKTRVFLLEAIVGTRIIFHLLAVMKQQSVAFIFFLLSTGSFGLHRRDGKMSNPKTPPVTVKGNGILHHHHVLSLY